MTDSMLAPSLVQNLLDYQPDTGKLFWIPRTPAMFNEGVYPTSRICSIWNGKHAGKEAIMGNCRGYKRGHVNSKMYFAHRLIWAIVYNKWPDSQIDHINHNRSDNRIKNLREVSHADNLKNKSLASNNSSGVCGVCFRGKYNAWVSSIGVEGNRIHLGHFKNMESAIAARKMAEIKYGFHPEHGNKS